MSQMLLEYAHVLETDQTSKTRHPFSAQRVLQHQNIAMIVDDTDLHILLLVLQASSTALQKMQNICAKRRREPDMLPGALSMAHAGHPDVGELD